MSGRNINIYLQDDLHQQLLPLIKERKVSKFINEAIAEKLTKEKLKPTEFQKKLMADYQSVAKSKKIQQEAEIWDETLNDAWNTTKHSRKIKKDE